MSAKSTGGCLQDFALIAPTTILLVSDFAVVSQLQDGQMSDFAVVSQLQDGQVSDFEVVSQLQDGQVSDFAFVSRLQDGQVSEFAVASRQQDGQVSDFEIVSRIQDGQMSKSVTLWSSVDCSMGRTKIFIRFPRVLFTTEDALQQRKHKLASNIQALYKGILQRRTFLKLRAAVTKIASIWHMYQAKQLLQRRRKAAHLIGRFVRGFLKRAEPECEENRIFVTHMKCNFLLQLKNRLPVSVLDNTWPQAPTTLTQTSHLLYVLHKKNLTIRYCKTISAGRKQQQYDENNDLIRTSGGG
ncbi:Unconventional myosin-Ic-A [Lamellibrachia satsuma]|nr:Unconventional myosin-Ic-A [Lamellibrachia satsuma]